MLWLDEADQMLDMGFVNDVKKIVKLTQKTDKHSFSATMPIAIRELAEMFFNKSRNSDRISSFIHC
jgi:ATP-dependent RNA helicase RhlE